MEGAGRVKCMSGGHDAASDQGKGWGDDGGEEVEEDIMSEVGGSWQQRTTVVAP
jgi:hypothetical protein